MPDTNSNVDYDCKYPVVGCPKYRRQVLLKGADVRLKKIREVCAERRPRIIKMEAMPDHVHRLVSPDPQLGIHRLTKAIKGRSSRLLRQAF